MLQYANHWIPHPLNCACTIAVPGSALTYSPLGWWLADGSAPVPQNGSHYWFTDKDTVQAEINDGQFL